MISDAEISACGRYRYTLTRLWNDDTQMVMVPGGDRLQVPKRLICFCGLNPSVADAKRNDQTILKEIAFGKAWGYDGLFKVNIYPWRETDPARLYAQWKKLNGASITGEWGLPQLVEAIRRAGVKTIICAWGTHGNRSFNLALQGRGQVFGVVATSAGLMLKCLGKNKDGSPCHPLYLPLKRPTEVWP